MAHERHVAANHFSSDSVSQSGEPSRAEPELWNVVPSEPAEGESNSSTFTRVFPESRNPPFLFVLSFPYFLPRLVADQTQHRRDTEFYKPPDSFRSVPGSDFTVPFGPGAVPL